MSKGYVHLNTLTNAHKIVLETGRRLKQIDALYNEAIKEFEKLASKSSKKTMLKFIKEIDSRR